MFIAQEGRQRILFGLERTVVVCWFDFMSTYVHGFCGIYVSVAGGHGPGRPGRCRFYNTSRIMLKWKIVDSSSDTVSFNRISCVDDDLFEFVNVINYDDS